MQNYIIGEEKTFNAVCMRVRACTYSGENKYFTPKWICKFIYLIYLVTVRHYIKEKNLSMTWFGFFLRIYLCFRQKKSISPPTKYRLFCLPESSWFAFKMHSQSLLNTCIKYTILILIPMLNHLSTHNYCNIPLQWDVYERRGCVSIISPCVMSLIMRKFSSHHRTTQDKQVYYLK